MASHDETVLVTGGSGFIGLHCILQLLEAGYKVRTTIRASNKESKIREVLQTAKARSIENLSFVLADLSHDAGWKEAAEGCTYVLHIASPLQAGNPKKEDDLIIPAREGTLRVLRGARDAGVKRVVLTSAFAAIFAGHPEQAEPFMETKWANLDDPHVTTYTKSKTLAERAAWDFIEREGGQLELTAINPAAVLGPLIDKDYSPSVEIVSRLLSGSLPGCPQLEFGLVDVRDVASLHIIAMAHPKAKGERYICCSPPPMSMQEMSLTLREKMGPAARRAPTRVLPNFLLRTLALFDPSVAMVVPELGKKIAISNEKALDLGWKPRSNVEALIACGESLINLGVVKK